MSLTYFTDRDLGRKFPAILAAAGLEVERHEQLFPPDGSDEQWLAYCGSQDRIAVTHNRRIRYTPNELAAVVRHGVALFVVIGHGPIADLATNFVNTIARIEAFVEAHQPPYIAKVYRAAPVDAARNATVTGSVSLWYPA